MPLLNALNRTIVLASALALLVAAGILTYSVVIRYLIKVPTDWQDEASVFLLVGATFLSAAWVQQQRGHIGIEAVAAIMSPKANRVRLWISDLVSAAFCGFFAWKSWTLLHEAVVEDHHSATSWAPPLWIPYGLMAVGMTLLTLQLVLQVVRREAEPTHHPELPL